jgi:hypothetical protein
VVLLVQFAVDRIGRVGSFRIPHTRPSRSSNSSTGENGTISDRDLAMLLELRSLRRLNLRNTHMKGAGTARLKQLPDLELVLLENSDVAESEVGDLRRAAPGLAVHR